MVGIRTPFLRALTTPVGNWFSRVDLFTSYLTSFAQHDYAPAISPDGSRVAYARHNIVGDRNVSGYSINYPFHKALSPDRTRVVTVNLQRVGTSVTEVPRTNGTFELFTGS